AGEIANSRIGKVSPGFQRRHVDMCRSPPIWRKIEGPTGSELLRRYRAHLNIHFAPVGKGRRVDAWNRGSQFQLAVLFSHLRLIGKWECLTILLQLGHV